MADPKKTSEKNNAGFAGAVGKAFDLLAGFRMFFTELKESIAERGDWVLRRTVFLFIVYLWISAGVLLMVLGTFDLLIEFCRVPSGVVFLIGGLMIFLVAVICLQASKLKRRKK